MIKPHQRPAPAGSIGRNPQSRDALVAADPPPGFFLGQQVTIVSAIRGKSFKAAHANVVALGGKAFKAENTVTRLVTAHDYADEGVSWVRGWVDDTEALVAARMLVGSVEP